MKSQEELELEFRNQDLPNWPGYNHRLEFRELKHQDAPLLAPVLRSDRSNLATFLGKFYGHKNWSIKSATGFVSNLLKQGWPSMTWLFHIGGDPVGLISTGREDYPKECQLIITVFSKHQGNGIASAMTSTILKILEEVVGFERVWWHVDAANRASLKVAQKSGFELFDSYDTGIETKNTSGYYHRLVKNRPDGLAPGILQGASLEYWWAAKDPALLQIMVNNQKLKDEMKAEMIKEMEDSQGTLFDL